MAGGRVGSTAYVATERINTGGRVLLAVGVVIERSFTNGRVVEACVVQERVITKERVPAIDVAAFLAHGSRCRRKPKAAEH